MPPPHSLPQGFDNDDGSSYFDTHDNFFYDAAGFKMDFGGHGALGDEAGLRKRRGEGLNTVTHDRD